MVFSCVLFLFACTKGQFPKTTPINISNIVIENDVDVRASTLMIVRLSDGQKWVSNQSRNNVRFPPASTSKIPHTLIALETQYAMPDSVYIWDGQKRSLPTWNQNQTLASAYQRSAVWVFQNITLGLGHATMSEWIQKFEYGNMNIGALEDLTTYWLNGPLETSANDQIQFLTKLAQGELPLLEKTYQNARKIMAVKRGKNWTLYAKTGWRNDGVNTDIGWYVGWLESSINGRDEVYVFALNMDMPDPKQMQKHKNVIYFALEFMAAMPSDTFKDL